MFRVLLCPSSGAPDFDVDYYVGCFVLGLLYVGGEVQFGWSSVRVAGSSMTGNQHHIRKLLMMGIVMPEIC